MSSNSIRKPEYRLLLGYPDVVLTRVGVEDPVGTAAPGTERFGADLRRLAAEVVRAGGRLTVVLPAGEVWRGQVEPEGRAPRAEWRAARIRAAAALGVAPDALATVVGRRTAGGHVPAAAVRRSTLAEVRALLGSVGLRPAAIVGAGAFEGFAAPPRLGGRWAPLPTGSRRALAGAGGLAVAAVALLVMGLRPEVATVPPVAPAVVAVAAPATPAPIESAAEATAVSVAESAVATAAPAPERARAAPLRVARADPPPRRPAAVILPAAATDAPVVTVGTRDVPMVAVEDKGKPAVELRLAELPDARRPLTDVATPLHRPAAKAAAATVSAGAFGPVPSLRPAPRPGLPAAPAAVASPVAERAKAPVAIGSRPMPRPQAVAAPVRVASLGNHVTDAVIAAAVLTPLARPDDIRTAVPREIPAIAPRTAAPKPAAPKPVAPKAPAPVAVAPRVVAPAPKAAVKPVVASPVVKPAPQPAVQRVVRAEPKPARVASAPARTAKPAAAPVRVAAVAPAKEPGTVRRLGSAAAGFASLGNRSPTPKKGDLALVGIFGGSDGRSALIQTPNGKIQKVSAGDSVQGLQIAAIGSDSVRVTDGRRESVIKMPN